MVKVVRICQYHLRDVHDLPRCGAGEHLAEEKAGVFLPLRLSEILGQTQEGVEAIETLKLHELVGLKSQFHQLNSLLEILEEEGCLFRFSDSEDLSEDCLNRH